MDLKKYQAFVNEQVREYQYYGQDNIAFRKKFTLGGSDAGIVLEVDPYTSRQMRMDRMLGKMEEQGDSFIFRRGHANEEFVADEFTRITDRSVIAGEKIVLPDMPWIECHTDRTVVEADFSTVPLEIKTISRNRKFNESEFQWGKGCKFNDNGELLIEDDTIPAHYMAQCQLYMFAAKAKYMYLAADILSDNNGIRIYKLHLDMDIVNRILAAMEDFMEHVLEGKDFPASVATDAVPLAGKDDMAIANTEFENMIASYKAIDAEMAELKEAKDDLSLKIKSMIGDHSGAVNSLGKTLCTLTFSTRKTFDTKSLLNDHPEFSSYYKESKPTATLRVK